MTELKVCYNRKKSMTEPTVCSKNVKTLLTELNVCYRNVKTLLNEPKKN